MSTSATLDSTSVSLAPGDEVVIPLQIRNNGYVVEGYRIQVVGVPAAWATVEPEQVSLYPGTATTATLTFRPPRSSRVAAGRQEFGVLVMPTENPDSAVVPEGVVEVLPFLETVAELVPRTSQGSRKGRHRLAVDNRGNVPVTALLDARDEQQRLRFGVRPPAVTVNPGEAQFADIRIRPARKIWRGAPVTHPFVVEVAPKDSTPVALDGTYVQTPVIPKWLPRALLALLALLAALAALWFLLLRPTIESQARDAVAKPVQEAKDAADKAEKSEKGATKSKDDVEDILKEGVTPKADPKTSSITQRLFVTSSEPTDRMPIGKKDEFRLTDLVLSNPQGDFGRVTVRINGSPAFDVALENFRDLDYHFVSPIVARGGTAIELALECRKPGKPPGAPVATQCEVAALVGGEMVQPG